MRYKILAAAFGLFCFGVLFLYGYSKAEPDYSTDETMPPFVLPSWAAPAASWEPYVSPAPSGSPAPGVQPESLDDVSATEIYARTLWFNQGSTGSNVSYSYITMANQFASTSLPPIHFWTAANSSYLQTNDDDEPDFFYSTRQIGETFPFSGIYKNINNAGYLVSILDMPQVNVHSGYQIRYSFSANNLAPKLQGVEPWMADLGIDDLFLRSLVRVQVISRIVYEDGSSSLETLGAASWDEFVNGFSVDVTFSTVAGNVRRIDLNVIVNPGLSLFPITDKINAYLEAHPETPRPTLTWGFNVGYFSMQRSVTLTEQEYNRNWFQSLFIPDPDALREKIELAGIINDNSGLSTFVMGLRDLFVQGLTNVDARSFIISFPSFSFPINGQTVQFWDGYNFDWARFLNAPENSQLKTAIRIFTDFLFVSAFANSLVAVFVAFWDTHLYNGVNGGGEED